MNKISDVYDAKVNAAGRVVDSQGHCTGLDICGSCPLFKQCLTSIKEKAQFPSRETRLRSAEEFLFTSALEQEIG